MSNYSSYELCIVPYFIFDIADFLLIASIKASITHAAEAAKPPFQADIVAHVSNDIPDSRQSPFQRLIPVTDQTQHLLIIYTMDLHQ